ncbi:class I SAM-dependent DNA methyltransferase [Falsiroseomonas ponticola]|uniref:class I SAM-dependent DNA methyltransferase n=1 Tax=Falsiroseomonas ponticola TaxID=2786951 RepID=UPI001CF7D6AF|nr:DNA methyltransferase [Roseomonas ponticola]
MLTAMTPQAFVAKWKASTRNERAAAQEHFLDLCDLLNEPKPGSDPTGSTYAFEKGATKATQGEGWADVWRRGRFAWEYKSKGRDLDAAHRQLLLYAGALENPPLLIVSDIERIVIRTNWTGYATERHDILLDDLLKPERLAILKAAFADPDRLRPGITRQALTERAATEFAEIARRLRDRGHEPQAVAHFLARLAFCAFADDIELLPHGMLDSMLAAGRRSPAEFAAFADTLFKAMAHRGGRVGFTAIPWFNGGLFDDAPALPLEAAEIESVQRAVALDWADIDPAIMGTLFERGLDPDKRSELGAHYTDREKIEAIVVPVVREPLEREWHAAKLRIADAQSRAAKAKTGTAARRKADTDARAAYISFLERLRGFRVLDPACGSGNFLYIALLTLKDLELRAGIEAEALGLQRELLMGVGPEQVLGMELNPYAAELARVSVWIGHIQWARRNGLDVPREPILRPLNTIETRDALLAPDGSVAIWPKADAIIGNPPFLGGKLLRRTLGDTVVDKLFAAYAHRVPPEADLVTYWFERVREQIAAGDTSTAGLVATNSVRGGANRKVLDRVVQDATLFQAWSDEPWTIQGAAVRVSMLCFARDAQPPFRLDGAEVAAIHTDLTASSANLTAARRLAQNQALAFMGVTPAGPFDVPGDVARKWLQEPANPNGRPNADVLPPYVNAMDLTRRSSDRWIVDFGTDRTEADAEGYIRPFAHVLTQVKPLRSQNARKAYRDSWWRHAEARPAMRTALAPLSRYIATPRLAKHRIFLWLTHATLPDSTIISIARDDDTTFGILHSRFHEAWSLRMGTSLEDRPRYTATTTFETFPFPDHLTPDKLAHAYAHDPHAIAISAAAKALCEARDRWLNPTEWVERVPEVVPGFPDRVLARDEAAARALKARTLTALYNTRGTPEGAWLDRLHADLDAAVAAAYGWAADISEDVAMERLLALNLARVGVSASNQRAGA